MTIFNNPSILLPVPDQDINVVRGDIAQIVLGFTDRPEVVANPVQYRMRLVFRRRQNDNLPDLAVVAGVLEISPPDALNGTPIDVLATFSVSTVITQAFPKQGCVYFIEWTNAVGGNNQRVLQGRVLLED